MARRRGADRGIQTVRPNIENIENIEPEFQVGKQACGSQQWHKDTVQLALPSMAEVIELSSGDEEPVAPAARNIARRKRARGGQQPAAAEVVNIIESDEEDAPAAAAPAGSMARSAHSASSSAAGSSSTTDAEGDSLIRVDGCAELLALEELLTDHMMEAGYARKCRFQIIVDDL